jgi:phosphate starvation-inducible membrane PsiE
MPFFVGFYEHETLVYTSHPQVFLKAAETHFTSKPVEFTLDSSYALTETTLLFFIYLDMSHRVLRCLNHIPRIES